MAKKMLAAGSGKVGKGRRQPVMGAWREMMQNRKNEGESTYAADWRKTGV